MATTTKTKDFLSRALINDNPGTTDPAQDYLGRNIVTDPPDDADYLGRALVT